MATRILTILLASLVACSFAACGKGDGDKKKGDDGDSKSTRRKIERLDPKAFIELTIEYNKEQEKWQAELRDLIKKRRSEFFGTYGLDEEKFNKYLQQNMAEFQTFIKNNPQYNATYMETMQRSQSAGPQ